MKSQHDQSHDNRMQRDATRADAQAERIARPHPTGAFLAGRRAFLRGSGGLTLALPFLDAFLPRRAAHADATKPRFFIIWHQGQGTQFNEWAIPGSSPTDFRMGKILEPLAAWKDRMMFFRGIDNRQSDLSGGNGHTTKEMSCLTAMPNGGGPSFDQVLSKRIIQPGQRTSLNLAVGPSARRRFYAGPKDQIESNGDPRAVLKSLFTSTDSSAKELERLNARRKSVLDGLRDNFTRFRSRLGNEDRLVLDNHAAKLRDLEVRFMQQGVATQCSPPQLNLASNFNPAVDQLAGAAAQIEIIVMAFACNLTPVASLEFTDDHDPAPFKAFTGGGGWHDMVHKGETTRNIPGLIAGYRWYSERFATLMERLAAVKANGVPLIDQTLVQWTADMGYGVAHDPRGVHAAFAGSLGAGVKMGRLFAFTDSEKLGTNSKYTLNNYYVSILRAFGFSDETFGDQTPAFCNGCFGEYKGTILPGPIPGVFA